MSASKLADLARDLIQQGQFADAEQRIRQEIDDTDLDIGHADALYTLAVAQRYQGKRSRALRTLARLLELDPRFARAYQEQGHVHRDLGDELGARTAYEKAVHLNPALLASWQALLLLYQSADLNTQLLHASEQVRFLSGLPKELLSVTGMVHDKAL